MDNLRCRPGDLARILSAWNATLIGRIVFVESQHSDTEWRITLLGEPGMTLSKDNDRLVIVNRMIALDSALEPLRGDEQIDEQHESKKSRRMHGAEYSSPVMEDA
ncbi:hypothetical protein [Burkholderia vietnamiensis]|uniref:hypothetical protein n=1 Tax=Burkholderia vietnamiensis TaxID=60552 RepID=UPI001FC8E4C8|nr:hypothetical protein [Burkholderia vietnamiensis]